MDKQIKTSNRDLGDYLYDRSGCKKSPWKQCSQEKAYFKVLNQNMLQKSEKRLADIKKRISNDVAKGSLNRNYQIRSHLEYKQLIDYCQEIGIPAEYEFLWCHGDQKTAKLVKIIEGDYYCCPDCDKPMAFKNSLVPVIYGYFSRKNDI